jgi:hypothetical protein
LNTISAKRRRSSLGGFAHLILSEIMPDHVHILIRKHKDQAEDMIENL